MKQVWFAGVHSDVGGSYAEAESGLSKIALRWMLCEAQAAGLLLDPQKVTDVLGAKFPYTPPDPKGPLHKSLHGFWWLGEFWPKLYYYPVPVPGQGTPGWKRGITVNLGRARLIPNGTHIHQSVFDRMRDVAQYRPKNLPQQYVTEQENGCEPTPRPVSDQQRIPPPRQTLLRRPSVISALALLGMFALCAAVVSIFAVHNSLEVPKIERPKEVAWLWQNWTEDQRHRYYHTAQGSELLPYARFLAPEQPRFTIKGAPLFRDNSYLDGFGFIPDYSPEQNPDGLPVGFARDDHFMDPYTGQRSVVLGLTCAACHTGELFYAGKAIRIEAGPSLIDLQKFTEAIGLAVT